MANFSLPYTNVSPGATITASQWNANMTACVAGLTDGTKDITVANATVENTLTASNVVVANTMTAAKMGITGTLTVSGLLEGSRQFVIWRGVVEGNNTGYPTSYTQKATAAVQMGYAMPRSGCVIAVTLGQSVEHAGNDQTITPYIHNSGTALVTLSTLTVTNAVTGSKTGVVSTFARGLYEFSAGQILSFYVVVSGTAGSAAMNNFMTAGAEVIYYT